MLWLSIMKASKGSRSEDRSHLTRTWDSDARSGLERQYRADLAGIIKKDGGTLSAGIECAGEFSEDVRLSSVAIAAGGFDVGGASAPITALSGALSFRWEGPSGPDFMARLEPGATGCRGDGDAASRGRRRAASSRSTPDESVELTLSVPAKRGSNGKEG